MTKPVQPDDSYLRAVSAATERAVAAAAPIRSDHAGADEALRAEVEEWVDGHADDLVALSRDLHAHPEEAFAEHRSAGQAAELLRRHGCDVEVGVGGL
ncbi:amidohydrolase, partial [Saccharopolyspora kobensis]